MDIFIEFYVKRQRSIDLFLFKNFSTFACLDFKISGLFISLPFIILAKNSERGH